MRITTITLAIVFAAAMGCESDDETTSEPNSEAEELTTIQTEAVDDTIDCLPISDLEPVDYGPSDGRCVCYLIEWPGDVADYGFHCRFVDMAPNEYLCQDSYECSFPHRALTPESTLSCGKCLAGDGWCGPTPAIRLSDNYVMYGANLPPIDPTLDVNPPVPQLLSTGRCVVFNDPDGYAEACSATPNTCIWDQP